MFPKITYLKLGKKEYKIFEPSISDLFLIEYLMEGKENIKENIKYIFEILNMPDKYIIYANVIIKQVLESFIEEKAQRGGRSYFIGDLGLLAFHNFLGIKEFMETYYLSNIKEVGNIREYYINIMNDKRELNDKFLITKNKNGEKERDSEMEDMIKRVTGLKYDEIKKEYI